MKRVRLRLKNAVETPNIGRFAAKEKHLVGFDLEEVRRFQSGDRPASSSFDSLRSIIYKRLFIRVKRAERSARILFALDLTPSMAAGMNAVSRMQVMFSIVADLAEGFADNGSNEIGFAAWSDSVDDYNEPLGGAARARERITRLSSRPPAKTLTRPAALFDYILALGRRPSIVFVFSEWYETGDFRESLKRCLAAGLDIVPVIITDRRESYVPWVLGDILLQSAESGIQCFASGVAQAASAEETFRSLGLPFVTVDAAGCEDEWDAAFDEFFATRERERR